MVIGFVTRSPLHTSTEAPPADESCIAIAESLNSSHQKLVMSVSRYLLDVELRQGLS